MLASNRDARRVMLNLAHIALLSVFAKQLGATQKTDMAQFDLLGGGINAQVLFLFEKPGPMALGSSFISRDNDDPTAEATFRFLQQAGLDR